MNKLIKPLAIGVIACSVAGCGEEESNPGSATITIPPSLTAQGGGANRIQVAPRDPGVPLQGFGDSAGR